MSKLIISIFLLSVFIGQAISISIDGGDKFSLALKEDGTVWAWGNGSFGKLGDGTSSNRVLPVQVMGLTDVISISAGSEHSLALKRDGTVWAWGDNYYGQVGDGTRRTRYTPVQVVGLSGVIAIAAGDYHSLALKTDGTAWAWGVDYMGQLGDGDDGDSQNYSTVPVQAIGISNGIAIAAGGDQSLALQKDGTVWNWGRYDTYDTYITIFNEAPVQVDGISNVIAVAASVQHALALKSDGTVWAWGDNYWGPLGDGNGGVLGRYSLIPVQSLVSGVIAIEAGSHFSLALTSYGTVWFWGYMALDFLGTEVLSSLIPVPVDGILHVKAIAAGDNHILAVKDDGAIWAWGQNFLGQLGNGTYDQYGQSYPIQVQGLSTDSSDPIINPDVQVNNADGPVTVSAFTPITVTVQISPAYLGLEADWWIAAKGGDSWFYLTLEDFLPKWTAMTDYTEMQPIYQGPLAPIGPVPIIESEYWLPRGDYEFFFAVDTLMDGLLTLEALHYDSALLTIK